MPSTPGDLVVLTQGRLPDLKRARDALSHEGVSAEILRPPGCSTGS